ncbi:aromatic-ring-hydroxylating dioxygenase subunit beta [soil metagenome]
MTNLSSPSASTLASAELKQAVVQLYEDYADEICSGSLENWASFFTDDCKYRAMSRENYDRGLRHATIYADGIGMIRDRMAAIRDCTVFEPRYTRHFLSGIRITGVEGDTIVSRCRFLVIESVSDSQPYVHVVGEYFDKVVKGAGGLQFQERFAVFDNYRIFNSLVVPI